MRICDRHLLDRRPIDDDAERLAAVSAVIGAVRSRGDAALREYTERFDHVRLDDFRVPQPARALELVDPEVVAALKAAAERLEAFHRRQPVTSWMTRDCARRSLHSVLNAFAVRARSPTSPSRDSAR